MVCKKCGHDKKKHSIIQGEGWRKRGNKHEGKCQFFDMLTGKRGNFCDCEGFIK